MTTGNSFDGRALIASWRQLQRRRQAEDEQRRKALRSAQSIARKSWLATARAALAGASRVQQRAALRFVRDEIDLLQRREMRDLQDTIRRERREAVEGDVGHAMVDWSVDGVGNADRLTRSELIRRLRTNGVEVLSSPEARTVAQQIRNGGSDHEKRELGKAFAGIHPGRPKRSDDPRDVEKMRTQKSEIQGRLVSLRREWIRGGSDRSRYSSMLERELVTLLGVSDQNRQTILSLISDPDLKPVEAASRIVGVKYRVPASFVRRLRPAPSRAARKPPPDAPAAQMGERQRSRDRRERLARLEITRQ